ncbi:MAG: class I SAM-dependent methyltransferase [Cellvibrionaceae bacterium]
MTVTPAEFWDRIALRYSKQAIADTESYEKKLAATQAHMHQDMKVLELGCGTGSTALAHAPHVAQMVATDLSSAMIAIGREKAKDAGIDNIRFMQTSVEDLQEPDGTYDMVLALNLLHLIPNRHAALSKIYRQLKTDGIFISSTVCLSDKMWFLRPVIPVMQWLGKAPYVTFLSAATMLKDVESAGFEVQEHWTHGRSNSLFLVAKKR